MQKSVGESIGCKSEFFQLVDEIREVSRRDEISDDFSLQSDVFFDIISYVDRMKRYFLWFCWSACTRLEIDTLLFDVRNERLVI